MSQPLTVLWCTAAGPRIGFGHLSRSAALAKALNVPLKMTVRGDDAVCDVARRAGGIVLPRSSTLLDTLKPHLVVVDDPSRIEAAPWIRAARQRAIPVAVIRDLGLNDLTADLTIDASVPSAAVAAISDLQGPAFAILDPVIGELRRRRIRRNARRLVIALGGGAHVRTYGVRLAAAIRRIAPQLRIDLAPGFSPGPRPALPNGCRWLSPDALRPALAEAGVAIVAAGVTLFEACALGTPVITVGLTPAQRLTAASLAGQGLGIDASRRRVRDAIPCAVSAAVALTHMPRVAAILTERAQQVVDGQGAARVAARLRTLTQASTKRTRRVA